MLFPYSRQPPSPETSRRIATIVWWGFLGSLPVYVAMPYLVHPEWVKSVGLTGVAPEGVRPLLLPLSLLAGLAFLASPLSERLLHRAMTKRLCPGVGHHTIPSEDDLRAALHQVATLVIAAMAAVGESIAIYGLLLGIFGAPPLVWLPFFVLSFLHMLWQKAKHPSYFQRADERAQEILAGYVSGES